MKKEIVITAVAVFILGVLVSPALAPAFRGGMMGMGGSANQIDAHFIEQMIPHHEDAITMAELALEKAEHEEIKQLARDIQRTQTAEIEKMQAWHKEWYGREVVTLLPQALAHMEGMGMNMGMMGDGTDLEGLENAKPFDKEFIKQMIPHHQMAVMMAQMLKSSTDRPEMKQLAEDIISAQTKEINQMRGWYQNWYR